MDTLVARMNADDMLHRHGTYYSTHISIICGDDDYHFNITNGLISSLKARDPHIGFSLVASQDAWNKFCQEVPPPEHHELGALLGAGHLKVDGDMGVLQSNFMYVRRLLEIWRDNKRELTQ